MTGFWHHFSKDPDWQFFQHVTVFMCANQCASHLLAGFSVPLSPAQCSSPWAAFQLPSVQQKALLSSPSILLIGETWLGYGEQLCGSASPDTHPEPTAPPLSAAATDHRLYDQRLNRQKATQHEGGSNNEKREMQTICPQKEIEAASGTCEQIQACSRPSWWGRDQAAHCPAKYTRVNTNSGWHFSLMRRSHYWPTVTQEKHLCTLGSPSSLDLL